jgi:hypothetical protein
MAMKTLFLFLIASALLHTARAQDAGGEPDSTRVAPAWNIVLSVSAGNVFLNDPGGAFTTSFPYTTSSPATSQVFNGTSNGPFSSNMFVADVFNLEFSNEHNSVNMGLGLYNGISGTYSVYLKGGYSFVTPVNRFLQLKPGINLLYLFSHNEKLGSIDNYGQTVDLLGVISGPEFTVDTDTDPDGPVQNSDFETDHLDVKYSRSNLIFEPKVTLSTRPVGGRVVFGLEGGWFIQVLQSNGVQLTQVATDGTTNSLGKIRLRNNGNVNGPYLGISIGVLLGHTSG